MVMDYRRRYRGPFVGVANDIEVSRFHEPMKQFPRELFFPIAGKNYEDELFQKLIRREILERPVEDSPNVLNLLTPVRDLG